MSALNKGRNTVRKEGDYAAYPLKAGAKIFAGGIVCIDGSGYAVPGADTAGHKFGGISRMYADNTSGSGGDQQVEVWRRGSFELSTSGIGRANVGDQVCVVDDQTVNLAAVTANDVPCGRISEYNSATSVFVDIAR